MDWQFAIRKHRNALGVVVAGLIALARQAGPRPVRRSVMRILRPAESALRRLIVVVAALLQQAASPLRGGARSERSEADRVGVTRKSGGSELPPPGSVLLCKPIADLPSRGRLESRARPLPDFSAFERHDRQPVFALIDPRKPFAEAGGFSGIGRSIPRICVPGMFEGRHLTKPDESVDTAALLRRIRRLQYALHTLPRQARRLKRLMARRAKAEPGPGRVGPIRPGHPPGHRKKPAEPVDDILRDCHWLAQTSGFKPP